MSVLTVILQLLLVLVSILLVGVILLQRNKGAGAGVTFGGGEAVFGADMGNVLTRSTIVLGFLFLLLTIVLSIITARSHKTASASLMEGYATPPVAEELPAPGTMPAALPEATEADLAAEAAAATAPADDAAAAAEAAAPAAPAEAPAPEAAPAAPAPEAAPATPAPEAPAPPAAPAAPAAPAPEAPAAPAQ